VRVNKIIIFYTLRRSLIKGEFHGSSNQAKRYRP
jgi:hypothetical protein